MVKIRVDYEVFDNLLDQWYGQRVDKDIKLTFSQWLQTTYSILEIEHDRDRCEIEFDSAKTAILFRLKHG